MQEVLLRKDIRITFGAIRCNSEKNTILLSVIIKIESMNFEDFIISPRKIKTESWQIGDKIINDIKEDSIVLLFLSDYRGAGGDAESQNFTQIRKEFYKLSQLDFDIPVVDLGDLVSGRTPQDSHYILQEVLSACHYKNAIPVIIGGSNDFAFSLFLHSVFIRKTSVIHRSAMWFL